MVLAAKIFIVREDIDLDTITMKIRDYQMKDIFEQDGRQLELLTEIKDLELQPDSLQGVFSQDRIVNIFHRDQYTPIPRTIAAPFIFNQYNNRILLTILEKKERANNIANELSKILFITAGHIIEARILPEVLKSFHEENFEDTKIIFFDDVDVPNVNKLSLYGSELGNTSLYTDYLNHGKIWYIVIRARKYGYVIGLTRNCVVTSFSKIEEPEFFSFIQREVFPLIA